MLGQSMGLDTFNGAHLAENAIRHRIESPTLRLQQGRTLRHNAHVA
jgi:hypothetical protein